MFFFYIGGQVASTFDNPDRGVLGTCKLIEEVFIGDSRMIKFSGVSAGEACTIVLRGATAQLLEEAQRSLHDAFCVLTGTITDPRVVHGGGASEMLMANAVDKLVMHSTGKRALAIEAFSRALRALPTAIADNGGYDSSELIGQLRVLHAQDYHTMGLDMVNGTIGCTRTMGISEPLKLKRSVLVSASEAAEMILRVDNVVRMAPRERKRH